MIFDLFCGAFPILCGDGILSREIISRHHLFDDNKQKAKLIDGTSDKQSAIYMYVCLKAFSVQMAHAPHDYNADKNFLRYHLMRLTLSSAASPKTLEAATTHLGSSCFI
jgi:hypothetical protein